MRWIVLASLGLCACGGGFHYAGTTGEWAAFDLSEFVPMLPLKVVSGATTSEPVAILDSGSPLTVLDQTSGSSAVSIEAMGVQFESVTPGVAALFSSVSECAGPTPSAVLGADLVGHFRLLLDYPGKRSALLAQEDGLPAGLDAASGIAQRFDLLGGGRVDLGGASHSIGATRIVVPMTVEGQAVDAMVDTGASWSVVSSALRSRLGTSRPTLCCREILSSASSGPTQVSLLRLREVQLGDLHIANLVAATAPNADLFAALAAETGRPIELLVGGDFLQLATHEFDYKGRNWTLWPRTNPPVVDSNEFVSGGFDYCASASATDGLVVVRVYSGTDAALNGLRAGDQVMAINGHDARGLDAAAIKSLLGGFTVGTSLPLTVQRGTATLSITVRIQDLLPIFAES